MSRREGQMKIGVFMCVAGHHSAAWRDPSASLGAYEDYVAMSRTAEAAKLDMVFFADVLSTRCSASGEHSSHTMSVSNFDAMSMLSGLAQATRNIGLVASASTTFMEPFNLARAFSTIDQVSRGRAGWNVVTTIDAESPNNFSQATQMGHDERYVRAEEFVDVVTGLWDSWDDDAFIYDRAANRVYDHTRGRELNHSGKYFSVRGPLNVKRPTQGHPILVQAGSSGPGRDLAARVADVIFTAQHTLKDRVEFYGDIKARVRAFGRNPDQLLVMPGFNPIVGRTRAEAQAKYDRLQDMLDPKLALSSIQGFMPDIDLSKYPLDGPIPELPETSAAQGRQKLALDMGRRENLTLGQLAVKFAGARGHWMVIGTAEDVADAMEESYDAGGADGFNLLLSSLPQGLNDFCELVVPELQRRGRFRTEYEGTTLREILGLPRPDLTASVGATHVRARRE